MGKIANISGGMIGLWLTILIIGVIILTVSAKRLNDDEITVAEWGKTQIWGWIFLGTAIASPILVMLLTMILMIASLIKY